MIIRDMADGEAGAVADMVHSLARDLSLGVVPKITAATLSESRDLLSVIVAEEKGALLGACLSLMTFSTFRAAKGLYVVDLFVAAEARNRNVGLNLLKSAARSAWRRGATFIKLEVDVKNTAGQRFYERIGFLNKPEDRLFVLEHDELKTFVKEVT